MLGASVVFVLTCLSAAHGQAIVPRTCEADIALVVDHSGSIRDSNIANKPDNWNATIEFLVKMASSIQIGPDNSRVGVVSFGNEATLDFHFDERMNTSSVVEGIQNIKYNGGNTNTSGALRMARTQLFNTDEGDREDVRDILLLITDGVPTREVENLTMEVQQLRDRNIRVLAIGVTSRVNETLLRSIVTDSNTDYIPVTDFFVLNAILDGLIQEACRTPVPTTPIPTTMPAPQGCMNGADLIFVIDGSGSIGSANFDKVRGFLSSLVMDFDIDNGFLRIGLVLFSDDALLGFHLNEYTNRVDIQAAVQNVNYPRGVTNTAAALRYVRLTMFSLANGDRPGEANIIVVITDGASTDPEETMTEARLAKSSGIHIITFGVGDWTNEAELINMASYPYESNKIDVLSYDMLDVFRDRLRDLVCNNEDNCETSPCKNGGQCVDGIDMYMCMCPSGLAGVNCERTCKTQGDIVVALDSSGSVGKQNFQLQVDFVRDMITGINLNQDSKMAVQTFGTDSTVQFYLDDYSSPLDAMNAMSVTYKGGTTNTAAAIKTMTEVIYDPSRGDRSGFSNVGILFTDGRSNDELAAFEAAREARAKGIDLLVVGIGQGPRQRELESIASYPTTKNVLKVNDYKSLKNITNDLLQAVCNDIDECDSKPCLNEGVCRDLINGYVCDCPEGFQGIHCERVCSSAADIVFVLDASGSIRHERFPKILNFIASVVDDLDVGTDMTRIGAVTYSDTAEVQFNLNTYSTKQDVMTALLHTSFMGGRTNTAAAEQTVRSMFSPANGARFSTPKYAFFFTDGNSNIDEDLTIPEAIAGREDGIHFIMIGVGTNLNMLEINSMASDPKPEMVLTVDSWTDLPDIAGPLLQTFCDDFNECESDPCQNGATCVDLLKRYNCLCPTGLTGINCERQCEAQMDLVFVLDFSGSVDLVYDLILAFTSRVIHGLPTELGRVRVAVLHFADDVTVDFYLDKYTTRDEILNALAFRLSGGKTNTQQALNSMHSDVFSSARGDRNGVPNKAVLISDGGSNIERENTVREAIIAQNLGIELFVVGTGPSPDLSEINSMASGGLSENVILLPDVDSVNSAADELLDRLCQ